KFYPAPNLPGAVGNFVSTPKDVRNVNQLTTRVDHRFTDKNSIFGRYSYNHDFEDDPFDVFSGITNLPGYGRLDYQAAHSISIVDTHVFNPSVVGEFRIGYSRYYQLRVEEQNGTNIPLQLGIPGTTTNPPDLGFPTFLVTGFDTLGKTNTPTD